MIDSNECELYWMLASVKDEGSCAVPLRSPIAVGSIITRARVDEKVMISMSKQVV